MSVVESFVSEAKLSVAGGVVRPLNVGVGTMPVASFWAAPEYVGPHTGDSNVPSLPVQGSGVELSSKQLLGIRVR